MDRSVLAARIQEILKGRPKPAPAPVPGAGTPDAPRAAEASADPGSGAERDYQAQDEEAAFAARCAADEAAAGVCDLLGGAVVDGPGGQCLVVDRCYPDSHVHGRHTVGRYCGATESALHVLPWFLNGGGVASPETGHTLLAGGEERPRLLFFDLETTGLSGGAGTYAFLVGCGVFEGASFHTRQFFLRGYGEERPLLDAVRAFVLAGGADSCLVTYNGRAFDLPLIETRYLFHRRTSPFAALQHVDMLYAARRLWRRRPARGQGTAAAVLERAVLAAPGDLRASCALTALEQDILGLERDGDVPGWEIPARYFAYTRSGDARGLVPVLEHNRLDLVSLAALTALILEMVVEQDRVLRDRHDFLALARLLEYLGRPDEAERCYRRASAHDGLVEGEMDRLARAEALHWLALHHRRARRFAEAAEAWQGLLEIPGLDADLKREACEALAIHHEHRARDLEAARRFALGALDIARGGRRTEAVAHRLDRLARKIGRRRPDDEGGVQQAVFPVDDTR